MPFFSFFVWLRSALLFLLAASVIHAVEVQLEWDPNTEPDLAGYRVYYRAASGAYANSLDAGNNTRATVQDLVAGETYYFAATAYNTAGIESPPSEEVTFTAGTAPNQQPSVALTGPANGAAFVAPAAVTLTANAADPDGTISRVEFFSGANKLGEDAASPFSFVWENVPAGSYQLSAVVWDDRGASTASAPVTISVVAPNQPPIVALTNPVANTLITAPGSVIVAADASDPDGAVARVEFFRGDVKLGESPNAPFQLAWNNVPPGVYTLTAVAWDQSGASAVSAPVTLTVNAPPAIAVSANGTSFTEPASIMIQATASDSDGSVARVEFYRGEEKVSEQTTGPFSWTWDGAPAGTHLLRAKAVDDRGAAAWSNTVSVTVEPVNRLPVVSLTSPENGALFHQPASIALSAAAHDEDGTIARVEYFAGDELIATSAASPFNAEWVNAPPGNHSITARAYDDRGGSSVSGPVIVSVNAAPQISISVSATTVPAGGSFTINAVASDADGSIKRVLFYSGTILLGKDPRSPYMFTWDRPVAGRHVITAVAYDNLGASTRSQSITVEVSGPNPPQSTSVKLPATQLLGFSYEGEFEMNLTGTAGDIYDVWYSDDLKTWSLLVSVLNAEGTLIVSDPAPGAGRRFYRVSIH